MHRKISLRFVFGVCIVLILFFGFALRMYRLSSYDFWFDEILTTRFTYTFYQTYSNFCHMVVKMSSLLRPASFGSHFIQYFLSTLQGDSHPPFYYAFVYAYSFYFRQETSLRVLSVVFSMLALVISYAVARKFLNKRGSLVALCIMAFSAFQLWYAQEAREYAMTCFFSILTVYCFFCVRENKSKWRWLAFWGVGVITILSSYYALVLLFFLWFYLAYKNKPQITFLHIVFSEVILAVTLVLLSPLMFEQLWRLSRGFHWLWPPLLRTFLLSPAVFVGGYLAQPWQMVFGIVICWVLLLAGLIAFFREDKEKFLLIFSFSLFPVILIFMAARIWRPIYLDRQLIIFTPFYYILIAKGIQSIRIKSLKLVIVFSIVCFMLMALTSFYNGTIYYEENKTGREFYPGIHPRKHYMPFVKRMLDDLHTGDKIIVADETSFYVMLHALNLNPGARDKLVFVSHDRCLWLSWQNYMGPGYFPRNPCDIDELYAWPLKQDTVQRMKLKDLSRFWVVAYAYSNKDFFPWEVHELNGIFAAQYTQKDTFGRDGFSVWLYERENSI